MLVAEPGAGAAETADDFVDVNEDVVLFTNLLQPVPITLGRWDDAATARVPDGRSRRARAAAAAASLGTVASVRGRTDASVRPRSLSRVRARNSPFRGSSDLARHLLFPHDAEGGVAPNPPSS